MIGGTDGKKREIVQAGAEEMGALSAHLMTQWTVFELDNGVSFSLEQVSAVLAVMAGGFYEKTEGHFKPLLIATAVSNLLQGLKFEAYERNRYAKACAEACIAVRRDIRRNGLPFHCGKCGGLLEGQQDPKTKEASCVDCYQQFEKHMAEKGKAISPEVAASVQIAVKKGHAPDVEN